MTKRTLVFTLALALSICAPAAASSSASARGGPLSSVRTAFADGVYRPAPRARRARKGVGRGSKRRPKKTRLVEAELTGSAGPRGGRSAAPAVIEVDAEGLKKLLSRGDDPSQARPLLVNFWATWCDPCREEMPDLVKIDSEFRPRGLDFVLVSADDISEIKTGVPAFLKKMRTTMPSYLLSTPDVEAAMSLVDERWGGELPATFLLDREGKIVFKHFGRVKLAELRPAIEKALAGK